MPRSPLESACVKDLVVATPSPDMPGRFMSHIRVISSELPESAGATPTPAVHVGALTRAVSRLVFVTVTVRTGRCGSWAGREHNVVAVNADALVRLTRAVLPAISPTPLRYRLPLWSPTTATAIADRPARANSS